MSIRFGPFTLDRAGRQLLNGSTPVHLSPKAFELLSLLADRRPEAVSKGDVHKVLWPDTFVADVNLAVLIAEIRTALGDDAHAPRFIRTVNRFGYAFIATAVESSAPVGPGNAATCWVAWGIERAVLKTGENLLGRDPSADIRIDAVGVSRRHAVIRVTDERVTVEDLSSKNGTYVNETPVTGVMPLVHGTELRLGPIPVRFHNPDNPMSTLTVTRPSGRRG